MTRDHILGRHWHPGERTNATILFETADPAHDPEGLISKYVQFESFRLVRDAQIDEMAGTLQERLGVLLWYIVDYGRHRQNAVALPLSRAQVAFLNQPAPLAAASPAVTVALINFVARELSPPMDLRDPARLRETVYWWCVDFAPRFKLDDRLVTKEQVALLLSEVQWVNEEFPVNAFMLQFFAAHTELHILDLSQVKDRAAYFVYLVVYSFAHPHILKLLPRELLRRVLRETSDRRSVLDEALARFCFAGDRIGMSAAGEQSTAFRQSGEALLRQHGLSLTLNTPIAATTRDPLSGHTGECFRPPSQPIGPVEPGVAVIGPATKASGLGQAMRLSVDVLTRCEAIRPTVIDFGLDNPAPVGFASATDYEVYHDRRAINLIHLNAESAPLAFAYQAHEIFEESYNIGFFFWELNKIPKCHRLALELLDEIWVSSEYNREIYAGFTDKPVINVGMAVEALPDVAPMPRDLLGLEDGPFVFLTTFDSFSFIERKNPLGVIQAFRRAFPLGTEPVRLVIKTQNRHRVGDHYQLRVWKRIDALTAADPRIVVTNKTLAYRDLLALKRSCDCYVSLHRSEGWGFGMIEAMQLAMPVIATGYSGNMDFCTPETAYLVDYTLTGVRPDEYIFCERDSYWADPDLDVAARHMRHAATNPVDAKAKGAAAAVALGRDVRVEAIGRRSAARLAEVRAARDW